MNIKNKLRTALLKEGSVKNKYGCVMVYLSIDKDKWNTFLDSIDDDDIYYEGDDFGLETEPHVTILFGLHSDVPDADVEEIIDEIGNPEITMKGISIFENEKYDVLKFDVDSPALTKLNERFKTLPHTSNFPDYHPHMTIAYLKVGKGKEYIDKLSKLKTPEFESDKIVYSKVGGSKKNYNLTK